MILFASVLLIVHFWNWSVAGKSIEWENNWNVHCLSAHTMEQKIVGMKSERENVQQLNKC